jgi:hypothetical protein
VQNDVLETWISVVAMRVPAGSFDIDLDIAAHRRFIAELDDSAAEIRPTFTAEKTRMKNSDGSAV